MSFSGVVHVTSLVFSLGDVPSCFSFFVLLEVTRENAQLASYKKFNNFNLNVQIYSDICKPGFLFINRTS